MIELPPNTRMPEGVVYTCEKCETEWVASVERRKLGKPGEMTWVRAWLMKTVMVAEYWPAFIPKCCGCCDLASIRFKDLGRLLCKLGVEVKSGT